MAINFLELWIGDRLRVIGTKTIGTFEGMDSQSVAILKINFIKQKFHIDHLEFAPEESLSEPDISDIICSEGKNIKKIRLDKIIDLHIENLNPDYSNQIPDRILSYQIKSFEKFITDHKSLGSDHVVIIHGKGDGILRQQVHELLKYKFKARMLQLIHEDGATEVWL
ncbi:MAG: Smr/MutS family protein [Saprospiraceae bacterium]|nr:Smr/MutS family protein [Saprospiraceae bacterium]